MPAHAAELTDRLDLIHRLAAAARAEIQPRYRACAVRTKADGSELTDADLAAEEAVRKLLAKHCPDEPVLGEEFGGAEHRGAERLWIIDPIDGTQAFALGVPTFGVLIAFAERDRPLVGIISFPALGYDVFAAKGAGCFMHEHAGGERRRLNVSESAPLAQAQVSATYISRPSAAGGFDLMAVIERARRFRFVGDCLQHALVCMGKLDAGIDLAVSPWDVAAVMICAEEAGAFAGNLAAQPEGLLYAGSLVTANSAALAQEIAQVGFRSAA